MLAYFPMINNLVSTILKLKRWTLRCPWKLSSRSSLLEKNQVSFYFVQVSALLWTTLEQNLAYVNIIMHPILGLLHIPAEVKLLVEHQGPLQRPKQPVVKPALAAKHRWEADSCCHVAGGTALPQVRQEKARTGALAHSVQSSRRLLVPDVAHNLAQVGWVAKLLQLECGERRAVVAATVEDRRKVPVEQCHFT